MGLYQILTVVTKTVLGRRISSFFKSLFASFTAFHHHGNHRQLLSQVSVAFWHLRHISISLVKSTRN